MRSGILFSALLSALILSGAASAPAWADFAPSAEAAQPLAVGARALAIQPEQERFSLLRAAKIVQAQFQRARLVQPRTDLRLHFARGFGSDDTAHAIFAEQTLQSSSTSEAEL